MRETTRNPGDKRLLEKETYKLKGVNTGTNKI